MITLTAEEGGSSGAVVMGSLVGKEEEVPHFEATLCVHLSFSTLQGRRLNTFVAARLHFECVVPVFCCRGVSKAGT